MKQVSSNLPLDLLKTQWGQAINQLLKLPFADGVLLENVLLDASTPKSIGHGLGRAPQGWFLTDNMALSVVWRVEPFNDKTLTLESDQDTTISLWVF